MSAIRAINFLIGMTIHFGMEIMLQILTEVVLFYIFVQKNVRKNIRVVLTAMSSKVTYNVLQLALVPFQIYQQFRINTKNNKEEQNFKLITKPKALMQIAVMRWL